MKKYLFLTLLCSSFWANAQISPHIEASTKNHQKTLKERLDIVRSFPAHFNEEEVTLLISFLHQKTDSSSLNDIEFCTIKNDIVAKLCIKTELNAKMVSELISMYYDKNSSVCWQNYCIQYLSVLYKNASEKDKKQIVNFFINIVKNTESVGNATALIALRNLAEDQHNKVFSNQVGELALTVLKKNKNSEIKQLTALQTVTALKHRNAVFEAKKILNESNFINLKVAAIHTIRTLGTLDDQSSLIPLKSIQDPRIKSALPFNTY